MDWQKKLYPGIWCMLFIIAGFQIWIVKLLAYPGNQIIMIMYYVCVVAAVISLCLLFFNVAREITEHQ
jgi:hypothetical protein